MLVPHPYSHSAVDPAYSPCSHSVDLGASIEAFLCSCHGKLPLQDDLLPTNYIRNPYVGSSPLLSAITSLSDSNTFSSAFSTPLQPAPYLSLLYIHHSPPTFAHTEHTCLWHGCHSSFSSLTELVSHVNLSHLSVNLSGHPNPFVMLRYHLAYA